MRAIIRSIRLLMLAALYASIVSACSGSDTPSRSGPTPTQSISSSESSTATSSNVTDCSQLLARGWKAPASEPQIDYDPETGLATMHLPEKDIIVNIRDDAACRRLPVYGPIFRQTLQDSSGFGN